jgi:hypothetical protein
MKSGFARAMHMNAQRIFSPKGAKAMSAAGSKRLSQRTLMAGSIAGVGGAVVAGKSRRGSSYNPPRTAQGSGRNA